LNRLSNYGNYNGDRYASNINIRINIRVDVRLINNQVGTINLAMDLNVHKVHIKVMRRELAIKKALSGLEMVCLVLKIMKVGITKLIDRIIRLPQMLRKISKLGNKYDII